MITMEWIGIFVTLVAMVTSNCGGLGGGGTVVPIAMMFYGFDTR